MNEASLKQSLVMRFRRDLTGSVVDRLEDRIRGGLPDIVITWRRFAVWVEVKYGKPKWRITEKQRVECIRRAKAAGCFVVAYEEFLTGEKRTRIIHPTNLEFDQALITFPGFDHQAVVTYIAETLE